MSSEKSLQPKVQMMSIDDVVPYENNPRDNKSAIEYVANSIRDFGFRNPIIVDKDNVIIAGHTRLEAAKQLEMRQVPVIVASDLTDEQVKAFRIIDNKTAEQSDWNMLKLSKEIIGIDFELTDFGFSEIEIDNLESLGNDFFGTPQTPELQTYSPSVYTPNFTPSESNSMVSEEQVEKAKLEQETRFSSQVAQHKTVICPHCYEEFEID